MKLFVWSIEILTILFALFELSITTDNTASYIKGLFTRRKSSKSTQKYTQHPAYESHQSRYTKKTIVSRTKSFFRRSKKTGYPFNNVNTRPDDLKYSSDRFWPDWGKGKMSKIVEEEEEQSMGK